MAHLGGSQPPKQDSYPLPKYKRSGVSPGLGRAPRKPPKASKPSTANRIATYVRDYDPFVKPPPRFTQLTKQLAAKGKK